jgi:hypothetical protein
VLEVSPEIAKTGAAEIFLASSIGEPYGFYGFQGINWGFSGKHPTPTCSLDA